VGLVLEPGIDRPDADLAEAGQWPLHDLPHAPQAADGPEHVLSAGTFESTPLLTLNGALSLHEGVTPHEVVFPVRVLAEAGVETLLFVNTAASVDPVIKPGSLALVTDHINFQGANPLVGPNVDAWGPRFPDMTEPYDAELRAAATDAALRHGLNLHEGIYFAMLGPNAGTRAEYRMVHSLGANLVGTSTVPEVIAAQHMDVRVLAVSMVTEQPLSRNDVSPTEEDAPDAEVHTQLQTLLRAIVDEEL
jgi:purine-nucleoside phosphorylase